jgi:hypothetical protein
VLFVHIGGFRTWINLYKSCRFRTNSERTQKKDMQIQERWQKVIVITWRPHPDVEKVMQKRVLKDNWTWTGKVRLNVIKICAKMVLRNISGEQKNEKRSLLRLVSKTVRSSQPFERNSDWLWDLIHSVHPRKKIPTFHIALPAATQFICVFLLTCSSLHQVGDCGQIETKCRWQRNFVKFELFYSLSHYY